MYDLIVIGGGPAGSAAAILAARSGARVLLLERGKFPRHKVCGEFVSSESLGLLAGLLDSESASLLNDAIRIPNSRVFLDGRVLTANIDPPAASIARLNLDVALWHMAARAGAETQQQRSVQSVAGDGSFVVNIGSEKAEGRALLNASGRWSNLTALSRPKGNRQVKWIGLKAHFAELSPQPSVDLYFFEGGYCGVQPVDLGANSRGGRVNACAMVRSDVATSLVEVLALHPALQKRSAEWVQLSEPVSTAALSFHEPEPLCGNVLMVGDAAAFVDPFIGDGISLALRSGVLAAECLQPFFAAATDLITAAENYRDRYRRSLQPVYRTSSRIRRLLDAPRAVRRPILAFLEHTPAVTEYLISKTR